MKTYVTIGILTITQILQGCAVSEPINQTGSAGLQTTTGAIVNQAPVLSMPTAVGMAGQLPNAIQTPGLVDILVQQLGITTTQATGGAGAIFSMAQSMMSPDKFGLVSTTVPGMSQLLGAAPSLTSSSVSSGLMGTAANALGQGSSLGHLAGLASSFQSLGMNSGMINQFIPVILQYVQNQGGSATMSLLQSALLP